LSFSNFLLLQEWPIVPQLRWEKASAFSFGYHWLE
jgi:hypothetical protein